MQNFVYRGNEYERRGFLEQARHAKVGQGWDEKRYLQSVARDIPQALMDQEELAESLVTLPSGEKISVSLYPPTPSDTLFHAQLFESKEKVSVP